MKTSRLPARSVPFHLLGALGVALGAAQLPDARAQVIPETPLIATQSSPPMTMLIVGRDHKLFYEAYNDATDLDGDGVLDIHFKPEITYYGLFDPGLCYTHSGGGADTGLFSPDSMAGELGKCPGKWSGNWLNYVTTSRIDALRKVLYGGMRDVDSNTQTILRRAYIPQDAHSWGKEYHSSHGYLISDYTPFSQPISGSHRHFFGNLTANRNINCSTLNECSDLPPLLRVRTNVGDNHRIWQWASKERPVLHNQLASPTDGSNINFPTGTGAAQNFTVRVLVCPPTHHDGCKQYPNTAAGANPYKPVGLLHEYGENDAMLFGMLTGSYDNHMSGGRLRKVVSSFRDEVDPLTGSFNPGARIVETFDRLRIRGFNQSSDTGEYWKSNPYADSAKPPTEGQLVDWGNPVAEMMYEATRYFAGKGSPTATYNTSTTIDGQVGLSSAAWDDPYAGDSAANAYWCARANFLTISDINPSFDSDQIPGSHFGSFTGDLSGLDVKAVGDTITAGEPGVTGLRFIGESGADNDAAPTPKNVSSLGTIRGLAPEEPTKKGSYYSASVAHYAKTTDLRPDLPKGRQTVDTYVVALSSPLPRIEVPIGGSTITLVPFAKSVSGSGISNAKGNYQPTNQIVDFYVETIANSGVADQDDSINGGRYFARFRINFEDVEQGGDHDMDAIVVYEIAAEADGRLRVRLTPEYQAGGIQHRMGYVISGTTHDGVYLVVQDESEQSSYYLNVPPGRNPGYCDVASPPADCSRLPYLGGPAGTNYSERHFTPGTSAATLLKDPLWYAAKWGGFTESNGNNRPDLTEEWDTDGNGVPDTYFLVQNPLGLRDALKKSFDTIVSRTTSVSNVAANGPELQSGSRIFRAKFSDNWNGELLAYAVGTDGVAETELWRASEKLPAPAGRTILTRDDTGSGGVQFLWSALSEAQQEVLGSASVLNYLRGDTSQEARNGGTLRDRLPLLPGTGRPLGDLVHSSPHYVADTGTVYIGANDGMLHAFDADSGVEHFAYVPGLIFGKLPRLAAPTYAHTWFVDGEINVSPRRTWSSDRNILVASTGRGARGLFALDVTTPSSFAADDVLWEYDGSEDDDFGFVLGQPQIAQLEDGAAVVLVGNGHDSPNGHAVLYVFDLADGSLLKRIDTGAGDGNGLSTPTLVDRNLNGRADTVYAGDLRGNVWRFDLDGAASAWASHYRSGSEPVPLFTARDPDGEAQPISAQLTAALNTVAGSTHYGKRFVLFGTGSYVYGSDPDDRQVQSWYGIIDEGHTPLGNHRESSDVLRQRQWDADGAGTIDGRPSRLIDEAAAGDLADYKGWFIDLDHPSARGERITTRSVLAFLQEATLLASSLIPDPDPCVAGGTGYLNAINPFTGARLYNPPFDLGGDFSSIDFGIGIPSTPVVAGGRIVVGGSGGPGGDSGGSELPPCEGDDCEPPCEGEDCPPPEPEPEPAPDCNNRPDLIDCEAQPTLPDTGRFSWREIVGN